MTSTTKKVVAGVAAATAVATGVFVATYNQNETIDWDKLVPDINMYLPSMPDLDLGINNIIPKLPDLGVSTDIGSMIELNSTTQLIDSKQLVSSVGLNTGNLNENTNVLLAKNENILEDYSLMVENVISGYVIPSIDSENISEDIIISFIDVSKINKNDVNISLYESLLNVPNLTIANIQFKLTDQIITLTFPMIEKEYNFDELIKTQKRIASLFKDKRNVEHDKNLLFNKHINQWFEIYNTYQKKSFVRLPIQKSFRMISEVKLPKNNEQFKILDNNLAYYKSRGYDSVLIVFDGSENENDLLNLVKYVRYKGFRSFFAFGGEENLNISIFVDPIKLKSQLQSLAKYSEGFLLGWRRTSAHLIEQDIQYMNYMSSCVREVNKNCLIFGEVYYGNTAKYPHENKWGFGYNLPNYASGVVICNFGVESVNADGVVKYIIPSKIGKNYSQIAVITGQRPYYLTQYRNNLTQGENQKIKEKLELRFKNAGCKGTITLHDDGKNGIGGYHINNNLSETIYTSLK